MRKSILVLVLALILVPMVAAVAQESTAKPMAPFYSTLDEAKAAAIIKDRPVLVDFYAVW